MRMEDLDPDRSRAMYADAAFDDLRWLGIRWHEGPDKGGPFAPYVQSKRRPVYLDAWRKLREGGFLFPCRCSRRDLESALGAPHEHTSRTAAGLRTGKLDALDDEPVYPGTCRNHQWHAPQLPGPTAVDLEILEGANWRFRVRDGEAVEFLDLNLGPQRFVAGEDFGDFVVWRRDGVPSYQLACVADDAAMGITEVVATPMDADSVPMRLKRRGEWPVLEYPIEYLDERGERVPSWPDRYPMEWIDRTRKTYFDQSKGALWEREYMLSPIAESARIFRQEMFRVEPRERRWEACFAAIDPARTARRRAPPPDGPSGRGSRIVWLCGHPALNFCFLTRSSGRSSLLPNSITRLGLE